MMDAKGVAEITGNLIESYREAREDLYRDIKAAGIDTMTNYLSALPLDLRVRWELVNSLAIRVNDHLQILTSAGLSAAEMVRLSWEIEDYREALGRYA